MSFLSVCKCFEQNSGKKQKSHPTLVYFLNYFSLKLVNIYNFTFWIVYRIIFMSSYEESIFYKQ